ncbi:uncharacterized protein TM35_000391320 [Trypanosoma theileri]|uniref:Uncharacterized protein n=1 Tax=Trypanosoma theileri TaxID=67003 RepID=A0A1X0NKB2_9TRYP|nr:uncharacterized protein TM35_000391320 [Trypanosoma theileri]ORC84958.1 hypothetical protein TM35_000391320 [Trypanosoma theileri]
MPEPETVENPTQPPQRKHWRNSTPPPRTKNVEAGAGSRPRTGEGFPGKEKEPRAPAPPPGPKHRNKPPPPAAEAAARLNHPKKNQKPTPQGKKSLKTPGCPLGRGVGGVVVPTRPERERAGQSPPHRWRLVL